MQSPAESALVSFQNVYNGLDIAVKHGAFTLRVASEVFRSAQAVEIYGNHTLMTERGQKPAPGDPNVTTEVASQHVDKLYEAFEIGQKSGSFDVKSCIGVASHFEKLRAFIAAQRKSDKKSKKQESAANSVESLQSASGQSASENIAQSV